MTTDDAAGEDQGEAQGDPWGDASGDAQGTTQAKHVKPKPAKQPKKHLPVWQESILLVAIALGLAIIIKAFFVQAFYIPSPSMEPGLIKDDRILVQKPSYWFGGSPHRGDVIVFSDPGNWLPLEEDAGPSGGMAKLLAKVGLYPTGGHLVKRVIGTPGDVIHCCNSKGQIEVNGKWLDESAFLKPDDLDPCDAALPEGVAVKGTKLSDRCDWTIGPVPPGKLFVMGDNRGDSADSRYHLCSPTEDPCTKSPWVPENLVVGKVFALVWPKSRWTWIGRPDVFKDVPNAS